MIIKYTRHKRLENSVESYSVMLKCDGKIDHPESKVWVGVNIRLYILDRVNPFLWGQMINQYIRTVKCVYDVDTNKLLTINGKNIYFIGKKQVLREVNKQVKKMVAKL